MSENWAQRAVAVVVSLSVGLAPMAGVAQPAPGPALHPEAGDPPGRVGRIARLAGTVSFHLAGADQWSPASANLPVTTGSSFWTEPAAHAELDATGVRFGMDQSTELDVTELDDQTLTAVLPQGAVCVHVTAQPEGVTTLVQTPRGQVRLTQSGTQPGRYEVTAGDTAHPTVVTVVEGAADVTGPNVQAHAGANEAVTIGGEAAPFTAVVAGAQRDAFLSACLAADVPARPHAVPVPAEVARMTGGTVLDEVGDWAATPAYGAVWYPPADPGFVPYRDGHWGYVAPWGWTWVDNAAWGFAPSHYGRWVEIENRWGWIPRGGPGFGEGYRGPAYPVYAPAVVSFLAGVALGGLVGRGFGPGGGVGWVPLGPREPYFPPFRASDNYVRNLNVTHVENVSTVVNNYRTVVNRTVVNGSGNLVNNGAFGGPLVNRAAATAVPAGVMAASQAVRPAAQAVPEAALARPVGFVPRAPVAPTAATPGLTPTVARQFNVVGRPSGIAAPGPAPFPAGGLGNVSREPAPVRAPQPGVAPGAAGAPALRAAEPRVVSPQPGGLQQGNPRPPEARPGEPRVIEPQPQAAPARPLQPRTVEPARNEPRAAEPRAAEPRAVEPRAAEPRLPENRPPAPVAPARPAAQAPPRPAPPPAPRPAPPHPAPPRPAPPRPPPPRPAPPSRPAAAPPPRPAPPARPAAPHPGPRAHR